MSTCLPSITYIQQRSVTKPPEHPEDGDADKPGSAVPRPAVSAMLIVQEPSLQRLASCLGISLHAHAHTLSHLL